MTNHSRDWLTIREAALALGVSELTIRRRIKDGKLAHRLVGGKYYVDLTALERSSAGGRLGVLPDQSPDQPGDQAIDQPADRRRDHVSGQPTDQSRLNGARADGASALDLGTLLAEHARLAEMAGRAELLEQQLRQLEERHAALQEGALSLATRNGWLESKLEEREQDLKLLTDSRAKRSWWKRVFGLGEAGA